MKLNTDYAQCKDNFYLMGSDYPVYMEGEFYEIFHLNESFLVLEYEDGKTFPLLGWKDYFETTPDGQLRIYQIIERIF